MSILDKLRNGEIDTDHGLKRKCNNSKVKPINISIHEISTRYVKPGDNLTATIDYEEVYREKMTKPMCITNIVRFDLAAEFGFDTITCIGFAGVELEDGDL